MTQNPQKVKRKRKRVCIGISARIRPILRWESTDKCITIDENKELIGIPNKKDKKKNDFYKFNKEIFKSNEKNNDVFERLGKPLCDGVLNGSGYNSLLITYGQTGSGKTHTLFGSEIDEGVLPKMISYLQENCDSVSLSAVECYGMGQTKVHFFDLLNKKQCGSKDWSKKKRTCLTDKHGVSCIKISDDPNDRKSAKNLIKSAMKNGHFAITAKNPHSSRGHILFVATIGKNNKTYRVMVLDLAGSEGISALPKDFAEKIGPEDYTIRLAEAGVINNGLGSLRKMFQEIGSKKGLSKIKGTGIRKLLHPFLVKKCNPMIDILFTFSPSISNVDSSRSTFRISKIIGSLRITPAKIKQKKPDPYLLIQQKDAMIEKLTNAKAEFEKKLAEKDDLIRQMGNELMSVREELASIKDELVSVKYKLAEKDKLNRQLESELASIKGSLLVLAPDRDELALHAQDSINDNPQQELEQLKKNVISKPKVFLQLDSITNENCIASDILIDAALHEEEWKKKSIEQKIEFFQGDPEWSNQRESRRRSTLSPVLECEC